MVVAGDMTPEGGEESKAGENIVTRVTMEHEMEEVSEDNAAEAQDYFKEGYSPELAQVIFRCDSISTPTHVRPSVRRNCAKRTS